MKNKKGFTLIEALTVVGVSGFTASLALNIYSERQEQSNVDMLANDIVNIMSGFDKRVTNDKFELSDWSTFASSGYQFENNSQVSKFLSKALNAKDAPGCGEIDGWVPQKEDATAEAFKDTYRFVNCNMWEKKIPLSLNARASIINDGTYVNGFQLDLFFENQKDFENNFIALKKTISAVKSKALASKSGIHDYKFVSKNTGLLLNSKECITEELNCIFRATFTGGDTSQISLNVNGTNSMLGSKVKFQELGAASEIKECHRYTLVGSTWQRIPSVYCGIGLGYSDPTDITSAKLDYVEVAASSVSTGRVFLDKMCQFETASGVTKDVPCGVYNDELENKVVAAYDEIYATDALVSLLETTDLKANDVIVKDTLTVGGISNFNNNINVSGISTFNDTVTINGAITDVNLVVETSAVLNDLRVNGQLDVQGLSNVTGNLLVGGNLDVGNILSAGKLKTTLSIKSANLGQSCTGQGNGTIVYFNEGSFSDLAVCSSGRWKLVNTQPNQIIAFNGSCPAGFKKFTGAAGRTLIGDGSIYDVDSAKTLNYSIGDVGGKSMVALTAAELASHQHGFQDAYYSEANGPLGRGTLEGSNSTDYDNNLYYRSGITDSQGSGQAHENRMPYYVVNWCIYQ